MVLVLEPGLSTTDISILCAVYDFPDDFEAPKEGLTQTKARLKKLKLRGQKGQGSFFTGGGKRPYASQVQGRRPCVCATVNHPRETHVYLPSSGTTFVPDKSDEVDVFLSSLSTLDASSFHCFLMSTVVANRVEMNSFVNFALAIISQFRG
jgi:hypothetical protein